MKKWFALFVALLVAGNAPAQFVPGQVLNASALNAALATPNITGGTINGAPIGAFNPSTGSFTSLVSNTGAGGNHPRALQLTPPTCSSNCGTGTPTIAGSDATMIVQMGATGTPTSGWVITFNAAWASVPSCIALSAKAGMVAGKMPIVASPTLTTLTITTNGTSPTVGDIYAVHCFQVN